MAFTQLRTKIGYASNSKLRSLSKGSVKYFRHSSGLLKLLGRQQTYHQLKIPAWCSVPFDLQTLYQQLWQRCNYSFGTAVRSSSARRNCFGRRKSFGWHAGLLGPPGALLRGHCFQLWNQDLSPFVRGPSAAIGSNPGGSESVRCAASCCHKQTEGDTGGHRMADDDPRRFDHCVVRQRRLGESARPARGQRPFGRGFGRLGLVFHLAIIWRSTG